MSGVSHAVRMMANVMSAVTTSSGGKVGVGVQVRMIQKWKVGGGQ